MLPYRSPLVPQFNRINQENDRNACHFLQVLTSLRSNLRSSLQKKLIFSNIFLLIPFNGVLRVSGKSTFSNYSRVNNREEVLVREM